MTTAAALSSNLSSSHSEFDASIRAHAEFVRQYDAGIADMEYWDQYFAEEARATQEAADYFEQLGADWETLAHSTFAQDEDDEYWQNHDQTMNYAHMLAQPLEYGGGDEDPVDPPTAVDPWLEAWVTGG